MSGRYVNRSQLAETFGIALTTVDQWIQGGMPYLARPGVKGQTGWRFDLAAVLEWHRSRERQTAIGEIAKIDEGEARRRKLAAEAAIAEHELAVMQGSTVSIEDWKRAMSMMIGAARAKLLGIGKATGDELAIETDPAQCEAIVQSKINEALQELSESEIRIEPSGADGDKSGDEDNPRTLGSAARPHGKRVGGRRKKA